MSKGSFVDGKDIHVFCNKERGSKTSVNLYIRTGDLTIFDAKFNEIKIKTNSDLEKEMVERYVARTIAPELLLPLLKIEKPTVEDVFATNAYPEFERITLPENNGSWVYCSLFNENVTKRFLCFKSTKYTTTLYRKNEQKIIRSRKPLTYESVLSLI